MATKLVRLRKDLVGIRVCELGPCYDGSGTVKEAFDPPANAQGVGIDVLVKWDDNSETWHDAGDLYWKSGPLAD